VTFIGTVAAILVAAGIWRAFTSNPSAFAKGALAGLLFVVGIVVLLLLLILPAPAARYKSAQPLPKRPYPIYTNCWNWSLPADRDESPRSRPTVPPIIAP